MKSRVETVLIAATFLTIFASKANVVDSLALRHSDVRPSLEVHATTQSGNATTLPHEVTDAIAVLLANGGKHPGPLPQEKKKALELLQRYDPPEEGIGKSTTDGSYSKMHYFKKCNITWLFVSRPGGRDLENVFYFTVDVKCQ